MFTKRKEKKTFKKKSNKSKVILRYWRHIDLFFCLRVSTPQTSSSKGICICLGQHLRSRSVCDCFTSDWSLIFNKVRLYPLDEKPTSQWDADGRKHSCKSICLVEAGGEKMDGKINLLVCYIFNDTVYAGSLSTLTLANAGPGLAPGSSLEPTRRER